MKAEQATAFPGQGIQKPGMASALVGTPAWRRFAEASEILGYDLGQLCLEGPPELLARTEKAQAAIFVTCYALWELVQERLEPRLFLGHSLGEITAFGAAGAFSFATGVGLVKARGELMAKVQGGGMAAVLGLDAQKVEQLCGQVSKGYVQVANENSPAQIVVSGDQKGLEELEEKAKAAGARRVVRLNVSGPFHSKLMEDCAQEFASLLEGLEFKPSAVPVLGNDGESLLQQPEAVKAHLVKQLTSPVRFTRSIQKLEELGIAELVEISPESVLIPLARRCETNLQFALVSDGGM